MKEINLSDVVFEQIKEFTFWILTEEQELLIDKLILNEELKEQYKEHGLCEECRQPNTGISWCQSCNAKHFQQNFKNWTSGDHSIDKFIQNAQLKAKKRWEVLEWIEYDRFKNVECVSKGGIGTVYKAIWKDGYIENWDSEYKQWVRYRELDYKVALKCLHNSQDIDITIEFLNEIESHQNQIVSDSFLIRCYGVTKDLETNNFMVIMGCMYGLCEECMQPYTSYSTWNHQLCNAKRFQQNFKNWTSGDHVVDEFIQNAQLKAKNHQEVLEWIEYDRLENVEYVAEGGFGTAYKAIWKDGNIESWNSKSKQWKRSGYTQVVLKCLHNSQNITIEFLREIESHLIVSNMFVACCYGITKDPETNNFIMIMEYADNGSLRKHLDNSFNLFNWDYKMWIIYRIAFGLNGIHKNGLIHCNLHCGNILSDNIDTAIITDLGLYRPANIKSQNRDKKIYGVLPYAAPEVLREKEYTQASDIYAFGIIAYEVCTGLPPHHDMACEEFLAIRICQGLRPKSNYKIPQLILDIIKQCWEADPSKRPKAEELYQRLLEHVLNIRNGKKSLICRQFKEANEINTSTSPSLSSVGSLSYTTHPQAVYTSRLLDFKNLPEPKNA